MRPIAARHLGGLLLLALLVGLLGAVAPASSQSADQRLRAYLSTGVARLGEQVFVEISVDGAADASVLELPAVDGLEIGPLSGPRLNQTIATRNGRTTRSSEIVWRLSVRPLRGGEFVIPPFPVQIDGQVSRTAPLALTAVQDLRGEELGFFEITRSLERVVEGQPFTVELRFGWDVGIDRRINMATLSLPWWQAMPGVLTMEDPAARPGARSLSLGLNGTERVTVEELEPRALRGKSFRSFRLRRSYIPTRSGKLEFPTSFLEFGHQSDSGFFGSGRTRSESYFVRSPAFEVEVVPLPEEGRPLDYGGAIGSLELRADAEPRDVQAGESIKFTVSVTGQGNLEFFTAPDPSRSSAFDGLRLFGKTESKSFERREIVYDLAPLSSSVEQLPALEFPVFDPTLERYVVLRTEPIPIRVRALENALTLSGGAGGERFERDIHDLHEADRGTRGAARPGLAATLGALALGPVLWLGLARVRRRRGDPNAPLERRRRRALRELERGLAQAADARDEIDLLCRFLSARSREGEGAWVGRALEAQQRTGSAARLSSEGAAQLAGLFEELERAAYGGEGSRAGRERVLGVARQLIGEGL